MKRINSKCAYDIIPFDENKHWIIGRGRAYILNNNNEIEFVSPHIANITGVNWNDTRKQFIYYDTTGKCVFTDAFEQESYFRIFTTPFADHPIATFKNDYIYVHKSKKLKLFSVDKIKSFDIRFSENVNHIINYKDKYILFTEDEKRNYYIKLCAFDGKKMKCEKEISVSDYIDRMQIFDNGVLFFMNFTDSGEGARMNICCVDIEKSVYRRLLFCDDVCKDPEKNNMNRFSVSPDKNRIAMIGDKSLQIYDVNEKRVVCNENLLYGSDVCWRNNAELLVATWNGLFVYSLPRK